MSGLPQLLLEANISEMSGVFHTTDTNFSGGGNDKFLVCSTQIEGQKFSCKSQAMSSCFRKITLLPLVSRKEDENGPGSDAGPTVSCQGSTALEAHVL